MTKKIVTSFTLLAFILSSCGGKKGPDISGALKAAQDKVAQLQQGMEQMKALFEQQKKDLESAAKDAQNKCNDYTAQAGQTLQTAVLSAVAGGKSQEETKAILTQAAATATAGVPQDSPCSNAIRNFVSAWSTSFNINFKDGTSYQWSNTQQGQDYAIQFFQNLGQQAFSSMSPQMQSYIMANPGYYQALANAGAGSMNQFINTPAPQVTAADNGFSNNNSNAGFSSAQGQGVAGNSNSSNSGNGFCNASNFYCFTQGSL